MIMSTLVPGLEATARSQAKVSYTTKPHPVLATDLYILQANLAGTFTFPLKSLNSSLTLSIDSDLPGLKLESFISSSTNVLSTLYPAAAGIKTTTPDVRLYPSNLSQKTATGGMITVYHAAVNDPAMKYPNTEIDALNCVAWELVDLTVYGATGLDEFWVETDRKGRAVSVVSRAFGVSLARK